MTQTGPDLETRFFDTYAPSALQGRGAVVTGAGGGMGGAVALRFAQAGAEVVITDVREDALAETAELIERETGRAPAAVVTADVAAEDVAEIVIGAAAEKLERLTTLVNCAGIARGGDGPPETFDAWRNVMRVNLDGMFLLSMAAVPHIREAGGGAIVNIASIIGSRNFRTRGEEFSYPASKAGVLGLTQSMAIQYGKDSIRVNAISPGFIRTRLGTWLVDGSERLNKIDQGIPIARIGEPNDIAAAALFLASDASRYITGVELTVDGGMSAEVGWDRFRT